MGLFRNVVITKGGGFGAHEVLTQKPQHKPDLFYKQVAQLLDCHQLCAASPYYILHLLAKNFMTYRGAHNI